jgi:diacylglycerol kinase (ATP)
MVPWVPPSLLVITNAAAGNADDAAVDSAVGVLRKSVDVEVRRTTDADDLRRVLEARRSPDVVVVGGDGSLHAVAGALHRLGRLSEPALGLIPLGTGNDFARALGIPLEPEDAARVIVGGYRRSVDVLVDDVGSVVVNAVHAGVGAEAGSAAASWKRFGRIGYSLGAVLAGLGAEGCRIRVVADGQVLASGRRRLLQVAIANGPMIGGGVPLVPDADPADGLADVLVSYAVRPVDRLMYGLHLRRGKHDERADVAVRRAMSVSMTGKAFWCNADGEVQGPVMSRTWRVLGSAMSLFVAPPERSPTSASHIHTVSA